MASVQTPDGTDLTGLYQALMNGVDPSTLPPVPEEGPYGAPAVTRDTGPQSSNVPSPLAVALSGGMPGEAPPPQAPPAPPPQPQQREAATASPGFASMLASALGGAGPPSTGSRYDPATGDFLPPGSYAAPLPQPQPAAYRAPQAAPAPVQTAASDESDTSTAAPAMDETTRAYAALHAEKVAEFERNKSLALQSAQAGNTDISAAYAKAAAEAYKMANDISLLAIKHNEPAADTGEIKNYEYAQKHPGFPVPGAAKLEMKEIGRDSYGNPVYGTFNPQTGEITPYKPPAAAGAMPAAASGDVESDTAPQGQPVAPLPAGQAAKVAQLDPAVQGHVTAILQGRETMPKIPAGGRVNPITQMITQGVFAANPSFDAANNITQVRTRQTYAPGPNNNAPGNLIQNGDAALDHLAELKDASDNLANYGSIGGGLVSGIASATGGRIGHDYSAARAELDTKAQIASAEAIKYLAGATGGGEAERDRLMQQFSSSNPPDSRLAAIKGLAQDILEKKVELQAGWRRSMGPGTPDFEVISPNSVGSVNKLGLGLGSYLPRLGGSAGQGASAAASASGLPPVGGSTTINGITVRRVK
jgi:hypothetical protein